MTGKIDPAPHSEVSVGAVRFGNRLPLALIAGPCALESRAHALEMAGAKLRIEAKQYSQQMGRFGEKQWDHYKG